MLYFYKNYFLPKLGSCGKYAGLLFLILSISQVVSASTPATGTSTFAGAGPAGTTVISMTVGSGSTRTLFPGGLLGWDFSVSNSFATNNVSGVLSAGNGTGKTGVRLASSTTSLGSASVSSNDGSEYKLNSVYIRATYVGTTSVTLTITGYKNGSEVTNATQTVVASSPTAFNLFDLALNSLSNELSARADPDDGKPFELPILL